MYELMLVNLSLMLMVAHQVMGGSEEARRRLKVYDDYYDRLLNAAAKDGES